MNYIKRLSLLFVLLLSVVAVYAGGIKNAKDLIAFAKAVQKEADLSQWRNEKGVVCLEADIDMAKAKSFKGINGFNGTFDGQGFSFMNWKAKNPIFIEVPEGAVVRNIKIDASCSMDVKNKGVDEDWRTAYVVGLNKGIVEKCENLAPIKFVATYTEANIFIGGVVAQNYYVVRDSKNSGIINIDCEIDTTGKKATICVGGVIGICGTTGMRGCTIYRCENSGPIIYNGDMPSSFIGGVVGSINRFVVRYCVNKGHINAIYTAGAPKMKSWNLVGGIAGRTYHHFFGCDNFGNIGVGGVRQVHVGGLCGQFNRATNVVDCNNYGSVTSSCSDHSVIGGVFAYCNNEVHYCNIRNFGNVAYVNAVNKNAYVGGIGGYQFSGNKLTRGAYFRNCVNYGKIENRATVKKSAFVGGIVARVRGIANAPITINGCVNQGEVIGDGSNKGEVVGHQAFTKIIDLAAPQNMAEALPATSIVDGKNIFGRVMDSDGNPIEGVVVSDGEFCVKTDVTGAYAIKSNLAHSRFVYISVPSDYKIPYYNGIAQFFQRIPRHAACVNATFRLERRTKPTDKYTVVMMGDPQIKGVKIDSAAYKLRNRIYPDITALRESKSEEGDFLVINLGDLIFNNLCTFDDYADVVAQSGLDMHHAIGNHDFEQTTCFESRLGTTPYEQYFSPVNYSFNIGKVHYVIVNDISFARKLPKQKYRLGLEYSTYKWLERDLSFVPKDHTIVICGHAQLFRQFSKKNADSKTNLSYARYSKLLSQYDKVYSWSGHYHYNFGYDYANSSNEQLKNITSICVARACGGLHCNRDLNNDGTPNGYMVLEVENDKMEWWYKSIGKDRDYQMHVYAPSRTGGELVKVNIWNWSADFWSTPEWWENGVKVGDMIHKYEKDVAYVEDRKEKGGYYLGKSKDDKAKPYNAHGMFHIKPSGGVYTGEVRVTDNFGRTYIQQVAW